MLIYVLLFYTSDTDFQKEEEEMSMTHQGGVVNQASFCQISVLMVNYSTTAASKLLLLR